MTLTECIKAHTIERSLMLGPTFKGFFCPKVYVVITDLGVKIIDFVFTPKLTAARVFVRNV